MLLTPYRALKSQLSQISGIKLIDWFNDQYAGTIHTAPAIFVEFPNQLRFETLRKGVQQAPFLVRVHMVSKVIMKQDNSVEEIKVEQHFTSCDAIYNRLQGLRHIESEKLVFNSLSRSAFEHHQYLKGWMITTQDFESMIYQHVAKGEIVARPQVEINKV
jgi:hypothetical protein